MRDILRIMVLAALTLSACRRPEPENPRAWEQNPGLDPRPAGQAAQGTSGAAMAEISFRLDPGRGSTAPGEVKPRTEEEALYLDSALKGFAYAQTKLGYNYTLEGDDLKRLGEGLRWLNAAAAQNDADALRILSSLAAAGRGMDQSDKQAYKYMRRAADLGSSEAQYELAMMLANGRGMPRDMEAALLWLTKAGRQGHAPAQHSAGIALLRRAATPQDVNEGLDYLERAAKADHREATMVLAGILTRGEFGVKKDEFRAETLLMARAKEGDPEFQFGLATLYLYGEWFSNRREAGFEWLQKSAAAGYEKSKALLRKIEETAKQSRQRPAPPG